MRTAKGYDLSSALFGRTRRAVLGLLLTRADESFYLRELARQVGTGLGAVEREVRRLADAGILRRTVRGHQVYYQANPRCPIFRELKGLMVKTSGLTEVLRAALRPLAGGTRVAFIYGSFARERENQASDVDILVVGPVRFSEVVAALGPAQQKLGREINPTVYPVAEFRTKLARGHHFLRSVMKEKKIFLTGDELELQRLGSERLAHTA